MNHDKLNISAQQPGSIHQGDRDAVVSMSLVSKNVIFCPPQDCRGPGALDVYAAIVTRVNPKSAEFGGMETVELTTFGVNSIYFQHNVPYSPRAKPGHWSFP